MFKRRLRQTLAHFGLDVRRIPAVHAEIPDRSFYTPLFSPWRGYGEFDQFRRLAEPYTLVSPDRLYILYALCLNALRLEGEFWECGVYKGGTARMLAELISRKGGPEARLRLFDTFAGMPETSAETDIHRQGDFGDTGLDAVRALIGDNKHVEFHQGWIPESFSGKEDSAIVFCHVDLDVYQSVRDCCEFVYPRLVTGGIVVFDDYGFPSCPGARKAVDEFFSGKPETPIVLPTGQAIIIKLPR